MNKKKIITGIVVSAAVIAAFTLGIVLKNNDTQINDKSEVSQEIVKSKSHKILHKANKNKEINKSENKNEQEESTAVKIKEKNANLYENYPSSMLPLSGIAEISDLTPTANAAIKKVFDNSNNIYMIKRNGHKLFMVVENPENIRHGIEFIELDIRNGHQTKTTLGYNDKIHDSDNEIWEYDKNSDEQLPTRHAKYNKDGDVEFVEYWYYDDSPVKYEMKDGEGKTISIKKETVNNNTDMRVEHVLYDKNGTTKINVTAAYEGDDIKRFTYYNADKLSDSASVFGDYDDGVKVKETVYTSDLKVKNVYKADYKDGVRKELTVYDDKDNEVAKYVQPTPAENVSE